MPLTASDPHHWAPIPAVVDWLTNRLPRDARVLEIGPGHAPFKRADTFVDFAPWPIQGVPPEKLIKCDIATEPLPFEDKSFDFVYARHVLEDMWNPFHLCREMERVAKAGYIETPSPIAELCRGVDGGAPPYRGYHHHRWVVWSTAADLRFVTKYPLIEYLDIDESRLVPLLRHPRYWNTYHLWEDVIYDKHMQSPLHYDIPKDYRNMLNGAVQYTLQEVSAFFSEIDKKAA
jgi:hypothetical protein